MVKIETDRPGYEIILINPGDKTWCKHRYVLWFGAYGWTRLMVYANSLDDALDECIDWIADNAPGLLCDDSVEEEYKRLVSEGMSEGEAHEEATVDTTCAGNYCNYIPSWEWGTLAVDPNRAEVLALLGR